MDSCLRRNDGGGPPPLDHMQPHPQVGTDPPPAHCLRRGRLRPPPPPPRRAGGEWIRPIQCVAGNAGEWARSYGALMDATGQLEAGSVVFVINTNAGRRIPLPELESICEDATRAVGRRPYVIATQSVEEAEELALSAHDAGAAAIFACGGDGTLSTLLQGLPIGSPTALGTAPLGTANVFAYETGPGSQAARGGGRAARGARRARAARS